jgi:hypothetical protein
VIATMSTVAPGRRRDVDGRAVCHGRVFVGSGHDDAGWEWVRCVNATKDPDTRRRGVEVTIAEMNDGKRRPRCSNLVSCTDPQLARGGKLRDLP